MSVEDIVQLTVVVSSATLSKPSFGTPLALVTKVPTGWGSAKVRTFGKLSELTDLGFTSEMPGYKLAQKIKAQNPSPKKFKIAKRDVARIPAQSIALKCLSAVEGDTYHVDVGVGGGAKTAIDYTVLASATTTTVATAIAALITVVTGVDATSTTDTIAVVPTAAGDLVNLANWAQKGQEHFLLTDNTPDPGVENDLDAVLAQDSDFYGVLLDSNGKAEVEAAAAWTEANERLCAYSTSDTACTDSGSTTDVAYALKALAVTRTFGIYNENELLSYAGAAWMGRGFAFDPGKITWAFKSLALVSVDNLTTGKQEALEGKNIGFYVTMWGRPITWEGKVASGEWIDTIHGVDWLKVEMKTQIFQTISSLPKLPYTQNGLNAIEATGRSVLRAAVRQGILADDEDLRFEMPALADIPETTKAQRLVPDIGFFGTLAGAIHKTKIDGLLKN